MFLYDALYFFIGWSRLSHVQKSYRIARLPTTWPVVAFFCLFYQGIDEIMDQ